jgi:hypothetical protein
MLAPVTGAYPQSACQKGEKRFSVLFQVIEMITKNLPSGFLSDREWFFQNERRFSMIGPA